MNYMTSGIFVVMNDFYSFTPIINQIIFGINCSLFKHVYLNINFIDFANRTQISFLIAFCMITSLCHGIHFIKITIDPVDLWSSPNSQCRQEREFFNSNFKPFFRTTQVIIVPTGIPDVSLFRY